MAYLRNQENTRREKEGVVAPGMTAEGVRVQGLVGLLRTLASSEEKWEAVDGLSSLIGCDRIKLVFFVLF